MTKLFREQSETFKKKLFQSKVIPKKGRHINIVGEIFYQFEYFGSI